MNNMTRLTSVLTVASLAAAGVGVTTGSASGAGAARAVLARGLISPLTAGVADNGTAYVSENFAGMLVKIRPGHTPRPVFHAKKGVEVGGVTVDPGTVTFTLTKGPGGEQAAKRSLVMHLSHGKVTRFANTGAFERNNNPDAGVTYGFRHLNKRCLAKCPSRSPRGTPASSTPTPTARRPPAARRTSVTRRATTSCGSTATGTSSWSPCCRPCRCGSPSTGPRPTGCPPAPSGHRYFFEPVPTDVEVNGSGGLVVTTLTGATEAPGFGGQSRVYRVDPATGRVSLVTRGLAGAVGLAITASGDYLVSQLFGNELSRVDANSGKVSHVRKVSQPAAVERVGGKVYVTARVLAKKPMGRLLRFPG